jgi:beta-galactosidase
VRNIGENSRWYSGSGIYRHVWLTVTDPVNIIPWGHFVTTPEVSATSAKVNLKTKVKNDTDAEVPVTLVTKLVDGKGAQVAISEARQSVGAGKMVEFNQDMVVKNPALWSTESPSLYKAVSEVFRNGQPAGKSETPFGIRSISFDAVRGFLLNGRPLELRGGCIHHDNGPLGARAYDRAEERKIELLKASGFNAVRMSHNPPSPAILDACDRLGMMVIDEAFDIWKNGKSTDDYHLLFEEWWQKDLENMVLRDRNHPSIIMWSTGNEIPGREKPEVVAVAKQLTDFIKALDTTRPVTAGVNGVEENKDPFISTLDVAGYNYAPDKYVPDHQRLPKRVIFATESFALDAFEYWMAVLDHPWVIGDFVWTGFDYIGEASLGWRGYIQDQNFFPWTLAYSGDIDICGWKRPQSYYRDVLWKKDQISLFVTPPKPSIEADPVRLPNMRWHWLDEVADWNWDGQENKPLSVNVYSDCEQVELFLNGKSLGRKPSNRSTKFTTAWQVPYQPGALKAVGYRGKKQVTVAELKTAVQPSVIRLSADRKGLIANGQDLLYVTVELTDANGVLHPKAEDLVKFDVEGPATIEGVGNANPVSIESYQQPQRKAWRGRCLVVLKTGKQPGKIILKASAPGMKAAQVEVEVKVK